MEVHGTPQKWHHSAGTSRVLASTASTGPPRGGTGPGDPCEPPLSLWDPREPPQVPLMAGGDSSQKTRGVPTVPDRTLGHQEPMGHGASSQPHFPPKFQEHRDSTGPMRWPKEQNSTSTKQFGVNPPEFYKPALWSHHGAVSPEPHEGTGTALGTIPKAKFRRSRTRRGPERITDPRVRPETPKSAKILPDENLPVPPPSLALPEPASHLGTRCCPAPGWPPRHPRPAPCARRRSP